MKYESLEPVTHEQADAVSRSGDVHALSRVALSVALADDDLDWSTAFLLSLARHENANVRGNALLGFGHLARRFRAIADVDATLRRTTRRHRRNWRPRQVGII